MPRKAIPELPAVTATREALKAYMKQHRVSQSDIERATGVRQYSISRFLDGRTKSVTEEIQRVVDYAQIAIDGIDADLTSNPKIRRALLAAWDGSPEGATLIARTLEALAPVLRTVPH